MKTKIISIDFQKDFTAEGMCRFKSRPSIDFVKKAGKVLGNNSAPPVVKLIA